MTTVGYACVSTNHQLLDQQRDALATAALDRLGRSLSRVVRTIETFTEAGVMLRSLREGTDYSTATSRMLAEIFAALAAYERELMHDRASAARAAARARGKHTGRPAKFTQAQVRQIQTLRAGGHTRSPISVLASVGVGPLASAGPRSTKPCATALLRRADPSGVIPGRRCRYRKLALDHDARPSFLSPALPPVLCAATDMRQERPRRSERTMLMTRQRPGTAE